MIDDDLVDRLLAGDHRALARAITAVENRSPGYRELVSALYEHTGDAAVIGITGAPGSGKSTLVDKLALAYREQGKTVGVIAVDPSSPYTGGAVLGDRVRMASNLGDMDVFVRSMSARGSLGGLSTATADAVTALDAFGKDVVLIETVGAGQNEIDVVGTADTVAVLVPPGSGDSVQTLKAGILEIADVFVVNKADKSGADRTVQELREMIQLRDDTAGVTRGTAGHHGAGAGQDSDAEAGAGGPFGDPDADEDDDEWVPEIVETVATDGEGVEELLAAFDAHREHLARTGLLDQRLRDRHADEIRTLLREDAADLVEREIDRRGGIEALVDRVVDGDTDPYRLADEILAPLERAVDRDRRDADADTEPPAPGED